MSARRSNIYDLLNSENQHPDFGVPSYSPSLDPEEPSSSNPKPKRTKVRLTKDQAEALQIVFEHTPEPTIEKRKDLARDLGLTFEKVSRWFLRERNDAPRRLLPDGTKLEPRLRPTPEQKSRLEHEYALNANPSEQRQKEIALEIGLSELRVSKWFYRERKDAPRRLLPDGTKPKVVRRLTKEEKSRLGQEYARNKQPSERRQKEIAVDLGLSELTVSNWFIKAYRKIEETR
ncbi:hypothetical protein D9611_008432 [Ephemerocybe angulata]|uniref:Homeobox domain-containing protein n=1 Tax=Ephemerocybe angulata TaxID=980116 RepID=A0A8H5BIE5_9AGAR|nr:hypothetical protein D9611_008432 [Tulosesus angulatus]